MVVEAEVVVRSASSSSYPTAVVVGMVVAVELRPEQGHPKVATVTVNGHPRVIVPPVGTAVDVVGVVVAAGVVVVLLDVVPLVDAVVVVVLL